MYWLPLNRRRIGGVHGHRRYHEAMRVLKPEVLEQRRLIGERYLAQHADKDPGPVIDPDIGTATLPLSGHPLARATVEETRALVASRPDYIDFGKGSLDYLTKGADYSETSAVVQLAWSPEVLCPTIRYLGMMPILHNAFLTRANATEVLTTTSHMFHADPEDSTQIKAFVHISDVDAGSGPFHALPAKLSAQVIDTLGYSHGRIMDEKVDEIVGPGRAIPSIGPAGTVTLCDTTRCLHFGGRPPEPGKPIRDLLVIRYHLPTSVLYPQYEGDGETPRPLKLDPRPGDEAWNAFIGETLIY
jgi:hypothetical protein